MLRPNPLRLALESGRPALGAWSFMASASSAELLSHLSFDALIIDQEHGPAGLEGAVDQLRAASHGPIGPALLARAPNSSATAIKPLLDAGFEGILVPNVESAAAAHELVAAMHYPPRGRRGYHHTVSRAAGWGQFTPDYEAHAGREILTIAMIESEQGVAAIPEMMKNGGIDMAFIGPLDLSASIGLAGKYDDPAFVELLREAESRIHEASVLLGGAVFPGHDVAELVRRDYRFITLGADAGFLRTAALAALEAGKVQTGRAT